MATFIPESRVRYLEIGFEKIGFECNLWFAFDHWIFI